MNPPDKPTSLTLLQRVRDRDEDAWRRLMHLYGPLVLRWCGHGGVVGQDADDVQQEVFQSVATGLDGFRRDREGDTLKIAGRVTRFFRTSDPVTRLSEAFFWQKSGSGKIVSRCARSSG